MDIFIWTNKFTSGCFSRSNTRNTNWLNQFFFHTFDNFNYQTYKNTDTRTQHTSGIAYTTQYTNKKIFKIWIKLFLWSYMLIIMGYVFVWLYIQIYSFVQLSIWRRGRCSSTASVFDRMAVVAFANRLIFQFTSITINLYCIIIFDGMKSNYIIIGINPLTNRKKMYSTNLIILFWIFQITPRIEFIE